MNCSLTCYNQKIESPFGLLGDKERSLSFALGYTLAKSHDLLQWVFERAGLKLTNRDLRREIKIDVERASSTNKKRPDITVTVEETYFFGHRGKM